MGRKSIPILLKATSPEGETKTFTSNAPFSDATCLNILCMIALLKHIQIPFDLSFGIYLRDASSFLTWRQKILGKLKRKDDFKIVAIVAKRTFDSEPYDSFVE